MRSPIAIIALVIAAAPFSFAQTLDAPLVFSLSSFRYPHAWDYQRPTVKEVAYGLGDLTGYDVAATRLRSARRFASLSVSPDFSDEYDYDPFPIFPIPA